MNCTQCGRKLRQSAGVRQGLCTVCSHDTPRSEAEIRDKARVALILQQWQDGETLTTIAQRHRVTAQAARSLIAKHSKPRFLTFLGLPT